MDTYKAPLPTERIGRGTLETPLTARILASRRHAFCHRDAVPTDILSLQASDQLPDRTSATPY